MPTTDDLIEAFALKWCDNYPLDSPQMREELQALVDAACANEHADIAALMQNATKVYEHVTGIVSKPLTDPDEVCRLADEKADQEASASVADELRSILKELDELDKQYDSDYLRCCDAGSEIGAAQVVGKRYAIGTLKTSMRERLKDFEEPSRPALPEAADLR